MADPGRPTDLTKELTLQIRQSVLEGKTYVQIQEELGIPAGTWDVWVYKDYKGENDTSLRDLLIQWKRERMFKKAESVLEDVIDYPSDEPPYMKLKLDASKHITETLGKQVYSKKQELDHTTKGEPIQGFNYIVPEKAELSPQPDDSETDLS